MKTLCFDMDGTIANLYSVDNWLAKLQASDPSPYIEARPMWDMDKLSEVLNALRAEGWKVSIITWLSKDSTKAYDTAVRSAKRAWLDEVGFPYDSFHGIKYGTTKANSVRRDTDYGILIDDNDKVRKGWHLGKTINPTNCNLINELQDLLIKG